MPPVRLASVRTNNYAQEVVTTGVAALDGFSLLLTIPKEELVLGHSYVAVITGTCGAFWHRQATRKWRSAELTARLGPSTFTWKNFIHVQDGSHTPWQAVYDSFNQRWISGLRGLPFTIIYPFTMPSPAVDFHVVGRIKVSSISDPGGKFLVENVTAILWDLTEIAATSGVDAVVSSYAGSNFLIPYVTQALSRPITTAAIPTSGTYLIYHAAFLTGRNALSNDRIGLDDLTTQKFNRPIGNTQMGSPNPLLSAHWIGQQGVRDLTAPEQLSQWAHAIYQAPNLQGWYHHGEVLAIRLHADQQLFRSPTGPGAVSAFWAAPYQGTPIGPTTFSVVFSSDYYLWGHADNTIPAGASTPLIEVDGGEFRPIEVHSIPGRGPVPNLPTVRCENPQLHDGQHIARLWGEAYWEDVAAFAVPQIGRDIQVYGFGLLAGYIPAAPVLEVKGPAVAVVPGRETGLAVASLPELPSAPSYAFSVDVQNYIREITIPRGDQITHPKFLKGRRIFRFVWTGLSTSEGTALRTFFDGLRATSGGTFRWRLPAEFADVAFTLDGDSFITIPNLDQATYVVSFDALELVFVVP